MQTPAGLSPTTSRIEEPSLKFFEDDSLLNKKDKNRCCLLIEKGTTALIATTAYNLAFILPKYSGLTWGGILLGNAVAFPPEKLTAKKAGCVFATVLGGGIGAFLTQYYLTEPQPLLEKFATSTIYFISINLLWHQALKNLHASYKGPFRALIGSLTAVSSYKIAHTLLDQPWSDFVGSVGVIGGNMLAFPPPRASCNRLQKLFLSIFPTLLVALCNGYSGNEKFNKAATFIGNTFSLSIAWYYGHRGLQEQRMDTGMQTLFEINPNPLD